jgi:hypothetical protein
VAGRLDACPGTVQHEALTHARSRILTIVHVTSGCGRLGRYRSERTEHD